MLLRPVLARPVLLRRAFTVCLAILVVSTAWLAATVEPGFAAQPSWPVSGGLLISEVVTGGTSASDEFVEIYDAAAAPLDLEGLELVYVSATGGTVTRKLTLPAVALQPGAHLLAVNSAGSYAGIGDATYTGGLAADGGTLLVRTSSGSIVDSLSWGTAASSSVEGTAAPAPPARSSLERLPGGAQGNWRDGNDNAADFRLTASPIPQNLGSPPTPRTSDSTAALPTGATEEPTATADEPTGTPDLEGSLPPEPTETPTVDPSAPGSPEPTQAEPSASNGASPQVSPWADTSPSSEPSPTATVTPQPTPSPAPTQPSDLVSIAAARGQALGSRVHIAAVVAGQPGVLGTDDLIALADSSGGIFARVPLPLDAEPGRAIELIGSLAAPYGQLEVRELEWLALGDVQDEPEPHVVGLPDVGESLEGCLVAVAGTVESVSMDGERLWIEVGDGTTSVRLAADPASGIGKSEAVRGRRIVATGIVGQRASATGRLDGYRVWLRRPFDLTTIEDATPAPGESDAATAGPTATNGAAFHDLATGLARLGRSLDVEAVVTAAAGVIDWGGPTIVVDDGTAAVAVVLPAGSSSPKTGDRVRVRGKVGSLHSGRRVAATYLESLGEGTLPEPAVVQDQLGSDLEWRLVQVCGRIVRLTRAGQRWRADLQVGQSRIAVLGEPGSRISAAGLVTGRLALVRGIVRRSTSDSQSFLVLPRSPADMSLGPLPAGSTTGDGATDPAAKVAGAGESGEGFPMVAIADLPAHAGESVTVAGLVVAANEGAATLDDGTGRVQLRGTSATESLSLLEIGDAVEVGGEVSRADTGWQIDVDPERILSLAGSLADPGWTPGPIGSGQTATSPAGTRSGDVADAGQGLAHPSVRTDEWLSVAQAASLLVVALGLASIAGLAVLAWIRLRRRSGIGTPSVRASVRGLIGHRRRSTAGQ